MGQCCSAKSNKRSSNISKKYQIPIQKEQKQQEQQQNYISDRVVLEDINDFQVYKINASSGYSILQKHINYLAKHQNNQQNHQDNQNNNNVNKNIQDDNNNHNLKNNINQQLQQQQLKDETITNQQKSTQVDSDKNDITDQDNRNNEQYNNNYNKLQQLNDQNDISKNVSFLLNKEGYEFLKIDPNSPSIVFCNDINTYFNDDIDKKMLKIIFDFKEIIIHNNSKILFRKNNNNNDNDNIHPIQKLLNIFRQKNVKPKLIYILETNKIIERYPFFSDLSKTNEFVTPVLVIDNQDIIINQNNPQSNNTNNKENKNNIINNKEKRIDSSIYMHSRKQYENNITKYNEYLNISIIINLFSQTNINSDKSNTQNKNIKRYFFDLNNIDKKVQNKTLYQIRDIIQKCQIDGGQNILLVHDNSDTNAITSILSLINDLLTTKLFISQNNLFNYWQNKLPNAIFNNFKLSCQDKVNEEIQKQQQPQQSNQIIKQQKQIENDNNQINIDINNNLSTSLKIEDIFSKLLKEQDYNIDIFDKGIQLINKLIQNINNQFDKKEYRKLNKDNANLQCILQYKSGIELMNIIGFIQTQDNPMFYTNLIDDITYFKSIKSDFTIAQNHFEQSQIYLKYKNQFLTQKNNIH